MRPGHAAALVAALLSVAAARGVAAGPEEGAMFTLTSDAFGPGQTIPKEYTCDGADRSPALRWKGAPAGSTSYALVCDDPDAPVGNWNHWLLWDIPASATALAGAVPTTPTLADGSRQGKNDFGRFGYGGPCPPKGAAHRYLFKLYALSAPLGLEPGAARAAVLSALAAKTLATAETVGRYGR